MIDIDSGPNPNGLTKIPGGLIDLHVHARYPGGQSETIKQASHAAARSGITTFVGMPNTSPSATNCEVMMDIRQEALREGIWVDFGMHFGATPTSRDEAIEAKRRRLSVTDKAYCDFTTGDIILTPEETKKVFEIWPRDHILYLHAEGGTLDNVIKYGWENEQPIHIAHVSLATEVLAIEKAQARGQMITCEVTDHHLNLNHKDLAYLGPFGMMKPELGDEEDQAALIEAFQSGLIDIAATDHAPWLPSQKMNFWDKPKFGVPGLDTHFAMLATMVNDGKLSWKRFIEATVTKPRQIAGIPLDESTYIMVDMNKEYTINQQDLATKCGWSPFTGMRVKGRVEEVVLRGQTVYKEGQLVGQPRGQFYPYSSDIAA